MSNVSVRRSGAALPLHEDRPKEIRLRHHADHFTLGTDDGQMVDPSREHGAEGSDQARVTVDGPDRSCHHRLHGGREVISRHCNQIAERSEATCLVELGRRREHRLEQVPFGDDSEQVPFTDDSEQLFPLDALRASCQEVMAAPLPGQEV